MAKDVHRGVGFSGKGWPQYLVEITRFADIIKEAGAKSYLEIGCFNGDTIHFIGKQMPSGSRIVAVDWPYHERRIRKHGNSTQPLLKALNDLRRSYGQETHCILDDSQKADVIEKVHALGPFDAVFIDGDHTEKGVRLDWENYGCLGSIVAFHDIGNKRPDVRDFWNSLRVKFRHEIIQVTQEKAGIGVLWR